jgi:hypothetical protein
MATLSVSMQSIRIFAGIAALSYAIVAGAELIGSGPSGACRQAPSASSGGLLPGKYFEAKGKEYMAKDDMTGASAAFEHAAYYGNKEAQYNVAMMYLKGAKKIPIDVPLGIAWLRVAAAYGHSDSVDALKKLEPALTPEQQQIAASQFQKLKEKYGVAVTRRRVVSLFQRERGLSLFADWICSGGETMARDRYIAQIDEEFSDYVTTMFGKVTVEPIQPLPNQDDKK